MAADDIDFLLQTGCLVLTAAETCLTDADVPLPERRFVAACEPDLACCDSLIVYLASVRLEDDFSSSSTKCITRKVFTFEVVIARCVQVFGADGAADPPLGDCAAPVPGTVASDAQVVLTDKWVLFTCLADSIKNTAEQGQPFCCQPVRIVAVQSLCGGGCAGSRFTLELKM